MRCSREMTYDPLRMTLRRTSGIRRLKIFPDALFDHLERVEALLDDSPLGLVTDLDGTLSPLQEHPVGVAISPASRTSLSRLARRLPLVAVLSGRRVEEVRSIVNVEDVLYVGNHGLEQWQRGKVRVLKEAEPFRQAVQEALALLRSLSLPGVYVEDKGVVAAFHYRQAPDPVAARAAVLEPLESLARNRGLRVAEGKMVLEVRPPIPVDKGVALERLVREHRLTRVLLLGDDQTDVDAFHALHQLVAEEKAQGLALGVLGPETPTQVAQEADLTLDGTQDVERFLEWLAERVAEAIP